MYVIATKIIVNRKVLNKVAMFRILKLAMRLNYFTKHLTNVVFAYFSAPNKIELYIIKLHCFDIIL